MALILPGGGVADIRGSIAGTTFSRSRSGNYARSRTKPVNPRSNLQGARRSVTAFLQNYWGQQLTEQQRTDWRAYAAGTVWTNKLGQTIEINGNAAFIRLNLLYNLATGSVWAAAPSAMGHAGGVGFTFTFSAAAAEVSVDDPTGVWDSSGDENHLYVFQGIPASPGRLATPKGFRLIGVIHGDSIAPPAFPYAIATAYTTQAGQRVTCRAMYNDDNARVSGPFFYNVAAVA